MSLASYGTAVELCFAVNVLFSGWVILHDAVRRNALQNTARQLADALAEEWQAARWIAGICRVLRLVAMGSGAFFATAIYVGLFTIPTVPLPHGLPNGWGDALEPYWGFIVWCACYLSAVAVVAMQVISWGFGMLAGLTARFARKITEAHRIRADIEARMAEMNMPSEGRETE